MQKTLRCAGYAAGGAALIGGGMSALFALLGGLFWLTNYLVAVLEIPRGYELLVGALIISMGIGAVFGAIVCITSRE